MSVMPTPEQLDALAKSGLEGAIVMVNLLRFREPEFPWNSCVFQRCQRRCSGAAVIPADQHHVSVRFCNTCSDCADTYFGHELHGHTSLWIYVLQVVNQLREVLKRVNIVMRRR